MTAHDPGPAPTPSPPPGRYGAPPMRGRRASRVLVGVALAGAVGAAAWLGLRVGVAPVSGQEVAFRVADDAVEVTFDVVRPDPSRPATCRVEALNESHAQVGVVTVDVPASADGRVRLTTTVRTSERAVTGTVRSCRLVD